MFALLHDTFQRSAYLRLLAVLVLYLSLPLIWFLPGALNATHSFFAFGDAVEQSYAWMHRIAQSLHEGFLPLWNPYSQGGTSFVGEIQSGVFYPVTLAFAWFFGSANGIDVFWMELWVICHFSIGLVGMHWLVREMNFSYWAAIAAAICYAMLGPVLFRAPAQVGILFGLMWLPFAVAFAWRFYRGRSFWNAAGIGLILATQVNAGHIQPAFHTIILVATLGLATVINASQRGTAAMRLCIGGCIAVFTLFVVAGPQLYLGVEYLGNVYRWVGGDAFITSWERLPLRNFITMYVMTPTALLSIVNPWHYSADDSNSIFIGVCLAVLLGSALAFKNVRTFSETQLSSYRNWLFCVGIFGLVISLGAYTLLPLGIYPLPLGTAVRSVGRYVILLHFVVAVSLAVVVDRFVMSGIFVAPFKRIPRWALVVFFLHALAWFLYKWSPMIKPLALQFLVLSVGLLVLRASGRFVVPLAVLGAIASAIFASWIVRGFAMPPVTAETAVTTKFQESKIISHIKSYPDPWRVIVDESAGLPKNIGVVTGIQTKLGHAATYYKPYFDFISRDTALSSQINDALGVRWVISKSPQPLPLIMTDTATGLHLYERTTAYPRAWLRSQQKLLLAGKQSPLLSAPVWRAFRNNEIEFSIQTTGPDTVVISDMSYPGWIAYVNGVRTQLGAEDMLGEKGVFRNISLSMAGTYNVKMVYEPWRRRA